MQRELDGRQRKRVSSACQRCRKNKTKCSGTVPCTTCNHRGLVCELSSAERRVLVPESILEDLRIRLDSYEQQQQNAPQQQTQPQSQQRPQSDSQSQPQIDPEPQPQPQSHPQPPLPASSQSQPQQQSEGHSQLHNADTGCAANTLPMSLAPSSSTSGQVECAGEAGSSTQRLTQSSPAVSNPLVHTQAAFMSDNYGRLRYLGHSSTWSFSRQVLHLASSSSPTSIVSQSTSLRVEGDVYGINPARPPLSALSDFTGLPSLEASQYYLQSVKFRTYPLFHLFDEADFTMHLNHFYQDPMTYAEAHLIWFIHYLVLMAFGKAFVTQTRRGSEPPGLQLFERALRLLPDVTFLINERVESTETLCCIALYLESVDHRTAAHVYIGQAVRMALSHGLHNELQASAVGDQLARRGRRIWWTVYTLDRKLSSSMGVPNCLRDEDISASLAVEQEADAEISGLVLHVRISQLLGNVISTVYSTDGKLRDTCIPTAQTVLRGVAGLVDELAAFSSRCFGDVSRVSARLNLAYHQCIILTTRPFLYHLLQQRLGNLEPWSTLAASSPMKGLVQISIDSCIQTMMILSQLQDHDLLDTFLPFDLESAFSAAFALSMVSSVHPKLLPDYGWFDTAMSVFDTMAMKGNLLADVRKSEVEELAHVLRGSSGGDWTSASSNIFLNAQQGTYNPLSGKSNLSALGDPFFDAWNIDEGFSGTQIMDLADALDLGEMNHT